MKIVEEHDGYDISYLKIYQSEDGQYKKRFKCQECGIKVGECFCWDDLENAMIDVEETRFLCSRHYVEEIYTDYPDVYSQYIDEVCGTKLDEKIRIINSYDLDDDENKELAKKTCKVYEECYDIVRNLTDEEIEKIYNLMTENGDWEFSGSCCNR